MIQQDGISVRTFCVQHIKPRGLILAFALSVAAAVSACVQQQDLESATGVSTASKSTTSTTSTITVPAPGNPYAGGTVLKKVAGDLQAISAGQPAAVALRVQALDSEGAPVSASVVSFSVSSGSGTLSASSATTDSTGYASVAITAGSSTGALTVYASSSQGTATFNLTVTALSGYSISKISGNTQSGYLNSVLTTPLKVQVLDSAATPAANITVRFQVQSGGGGFSGTSVVDVATDSSGFAQATYTLGTTAGVNTVRARLVGDATVYTDFTETADADPSTTVSLSNSVVSLSASSASANGTTNVTVSVTVKDPYGNAISNSGKTITANASPLLGGSFQGAGFTYQSAGVYTRSFQVGTQSGTISFAASIDGSALTSSAATLTLSANSYSLAASQVTTADSTMTADGATSTLVTLTLKDTFGNNVSTSGLTVVFSTTYGTLLSSVTDVGNGTYTQLLRAPSTAGVTATVTATIGGSGVTDNATVGYTAGSINLGASTFEPANRIITPTTGTTTLTITFKDILGNTVTTATGLTGSLSVTNSGGGSISAWTDNANGTYTATLTAGSAQTVTLTAKYSGSTIGTAKKVAYSTAGAPSTTTSTITLSSAISAAGGSAVTATVQIKDGSGTNYPVGGATVVVSTSAGTVSGSVTDNDNGTYTATIAAPSSAQTGTVSATLNSSAMTNTASLKFYGAISLTQSALSVSASQVTAPGQVTLTLTTKDLLGTAIPAGGATGLSFSTTNGTLLGSIIDVGNGTYTQVLNYSTEPSWSVTAVVTPYQGASAFSSTVSVLFVNTSYNLLGTTIDCSNCVALGYCPGGTGPFKNLSFQGGTVTVNGSTNGTRCTNPIKFNSITLNSGAILTSTTSTTSNWYALDVDVVGNVTINSGGQINLDSKGYLGASAGVTTTWPNCVYGRTSGNVTGVYGPAGGSNGGYGGGVQFYVYPGAYFSRMATYGSASNPTVPGSGGGAYYSGPTLISGTYCNTTSIPGTGGNGGGLIRITAGGNIVNDGTISANGGSASGGGAGGGSGGSVYLNFTGTLTGSGSITANGGSGLNEGTAGGGGRISINGDDSGYASTKYAVLRGSQGGSIANTKIAAEFDPQGGTIYRSLGAYSGATTLTTDLTVMYGSADTSNILGSSTQLTVNGSYVLNASSASTLDVMSLAALTLQSGAKLTHLVANAGAFYLVNLSISGALTIDSSSSIDVIGKGYLGGGVGSNANSSSGLTLGNSNGPIFSSTPAYSFGGGNYGGAGSSYNSTALPQYGTASDPTHLGTGGAGNTLVGAIYGGGCGGGLIRITTGSTTLNGSILANGQTALSYGAGGSGGGIKLTTSGISGSGVIRANAGVSGAYGTSVGGGRVALFCTGTCTTGSISMQANRFTTTDTTAENGTVYKDLNGTVTCSGPAPCN